MAINVRDLALFLKSSFDYIRFKVRTESQEKIKAKLEEVYLAFVDGRMLLVEESNLKALLPRWIKQGMQGSLEELSESDKLMGGLTFGEGDKTGQTASKEDQAKPYPQPGSIVRNLYSNHPKQTVLASST